jgi:hypothetical protein
LPPDEDLGKHWRWDRRGHLATTGGKTLFLVTGRGAHGDGAWVVDLRHSDAELQPLVRPNEEFRIETISEHSKTLLLAKGDRRFEREEELQVRMIEEVGDEPRLKVAGTKYGDLSGDGRWLKAADHLYDLKGVAPAIRAERDGEHSWKYDITFGAGRPPLWLDEAGALWGLDNTPDQTSPPERLLAGLKLSEVSWDATATWLGLGSSDGWVWVVPVESTATLAELKATLQNVTFETALPISWNQTSRAEIESLEMLPKEGWVKAESDSDYIILWRGSPAGSWAQPIAFHERELFGGYSKFQCRPDGQQCIVDGQFLTYDEIQMLSMSRPILSGHSMQQLLE